MRKWDLIKVKQNGPKIEVYRFLFGLQGWRGDVGRRFPRFTASLGQVTSHHIFLQSLQGPGPRTLVNKVVFYLAGIFIASCFVCPSLPCIQYAVPFLLTVGCTKKL